MKYRCDNCGYTADESKFKPAQDLSMRLDPGGTYTDLECPKNDCGALAYPYDPKKEAKNANALREAERIAHGGELPSERAMRLADEQMKKEKKAKRKKNLLLRPTLEGLKIRRTREFGDYQIVDKNGAIIADAIPLEAIAKQIVTAVAYYLEEGPGPVLPGGER